MKTHGSHRAPAIAPASPGSLRALRLGGTALTVVGAVGYLLFFVLAVTVPSITRRLDETPVPAPSVYAGGSTQTAFSAIAGACAAALIVGVFCLALADVERRRRGAARRIDSSGMGPGFSYHRYPVRPVRRLWVLVWVIATGAAYAVILPLPLATLPAESAAMSDAAGALMWMSACAFAGACAAALVSLIKRTAFAGRPDPRTPAMTAPPSALRTVLYLWRSDIWMGGGAGVFLGISVVPALEGYRDVALVLATIGLVLFAGAVTLALLFPRTGEPLDEVVLAGRIGRPRR